MLRYCHDDGIKVVPRGAGTSLSGGALPLDRRRAARHGQVQPHPARSTSTTACVVAQPGVTNLAHHATRSQHEGFYYAPDPSSQIACTIGGNVAENSGGVHCLKYGLTTNNVLGLEMVLIDRRGASASAASISTAGGYDLLGVMTGSEGLLGVVTEVTVRILKKPETARALLIGFPTQRGGRRNASPRIIGAGIIPGGMEMMDRPAIHAAEEFVHAGYPLDVEALLIVELDGPAAEVDHLIERVEAIAAAMRLDHAAASRTREDERLLFWAGRKAAFPAVGRISPDYYCMDGTIPRARAAAGAARASRELSEQYGLRVANVFHAGDGNLHPLILYDANKPGELEQGRGVRRRHPAAVRRGRRRADRRARRRRREARPDAGDVHRDRPRPAAAAQMRLRRRRACSIPARCFRQLHRCAELGRMHVHAGKLPFPDIPRF